MKIQFLLGFAVALSFAGTSLAAVTVNKNNPLNLTIDYKWKFSDSSTDGEAKLRKGLFDTPVSSEIRAIEGGRVTIPCDVTPPSPDDHVRLVVLSNGSSPIYSIDARSGKSLTDAQHWKPGDDTVGVQKTKFLQEGSFVGFQLEGVTIEAQGDYFCRVDFEKSPTRNERIRLEVIVPPKRIAIYDIQGEVEGTIGPYAEGSSLLLRCVVSGGVPLPGVIWWYRGEIIDRIIDDVSGKVLTNTLQFPRVTRDNLLTPIICQANNSDLIDPLSATVTVDIIVPPKTVKIKNRVSNLKEDSVTSFSCESVGSRPPARITWWNNGNILNETKELIFHNNTTRSIVKFRPKAEDNGAVITCRAQNPKLSPTSAMEDSLRLQVDFSPRLKLLPGKRMNMSSVTEGDDVYLECHVRAQPNVSHVRWFQQDEEVKSNISAGIILSHNSLVLQNVHKSSSGNYSCRASNSAGLSESNIFSLNVKFIPTCSKSQQLVYGGGNRQLVNVSCRVEAHPIPSRFLWAFNTSADNVDIPKELVTTEDLLSTVAYTPLNHLDFGSLLCWASNEVGEQKLPCVFQVVPASPPERPTNCTIRDESGTAGEVIVACRPGWDGGLPQTFSLEVRLTKNGDVLASLRDQPVPHFTVTGLAPGTEYLLVITSSNSQGVAPPLRTLHFTPIDIAEKRLSASAAENETETEEKGVGTLLPVLLGVLGAVVICSVAFGIAIRYHILKRRRGASYKEKLDQHSDNDIEATFQTSCKREGSDLQLDNPPNAFKDTECEQLCKSWETQTKPTLTSERSHVMAKSDLIQPSTAIPTVEVSVAPTSHPLVSKCSENLMMITTLPARAKSSTKYFGVSSIQSKAEDGIMNLQRVNSPDSCRALAMEASSCTLIRPSQEQLPNYLQGRRIITSYDNSTIQESCISRLRNEKT